MTRNTGTHLQSLSVDNIALNKPANQSSLWTTGDVQTFGPFQSLNGDKSGHWDNGQWSCSVTKPSSTEYSWWCVDLLDIYSVASVSVTGRSDHGGIFHFPVQSLSKE